MSFRAENKLGKRDSMQGAAGEECRAPSKACRGHGPALSGGWGRAGAEGWLAFARLPRGLGKGVVAQA